MIKHSEYAADLYLLYASLLSSILPRVTGPGSRRVQNARHVLTAAGLLGLT